MKLWKKRLLSFGATFVIASTACIFTLSDEIHAALDKALAEQRVARSSLGIVGIMSGAHVGTAGGVIPTVEKAEKPKQQATQPATTPEAEQPEPEKSPKAEPQPVDPPKATPNKDANMVDKAIQIFNQAVDETPKPKTKPAPQPKQPKAAKAKVVKAAPRVKVDQTLFDLAMALPVGYASPKGEDGAFLYGWVHTKHAPDAKGMVHFNVAGFKCPAKDNVTVAFNRVEHPDLAKYGIKKYTVCMPKVVKLADDPRNSIWGDPDEATLYSNGKSVATVYVEDQQGYPFINPEPLTEAEAQANAQQAAPLADDYPN